MEADFSGYATKAGLKCSDGRTIMPEAFTHSDGITVPLVWQHGHNAPGNVLGHAVLEGRKDGVYAYGYFNNTTSGQNAKALVQHKDITALSIYANQLIERSKQVFHGVIKEVSLVLSGANPGALIDNIAIAHSDGDVDTLEDEAIIYTGLTLEHADMSDDESDESEESENMEHADDEKTVQDVYNTLNEEQKNVVHFMIGAALEEKGGDDVVKQSDDSDDDDDDIAHADKTVADVYNSFSDEQKDVVHFMIGAALEDAGSGAPLKQSDDDSNTDDSNDDDNNNEGDLNHQEGTTMGNVFERNGNTKQETPTLSHSQLKTIVEDAQRTGSLKESFLAHAVEYGIENIDFLFPDAKAVNADIDVLGRRMEWVASVIGGAKHSPFARIKTLAVDLTADEARAKGYVKASLKKEEVVKLLKRVTSPTTIYKKQKLDRDDVVDITDLDILSWLKAEMRVMLDEELGRAVLIGDGRDPEAEDKIDEACLRPIAFDDDLYAHQVTVPSNVSGDGIIEAVLRARTAYKGTGKPTFYTTDAILTDLILLKDGIGRRLYPTEVELSAALRVDKIVVVEVMESITDLLGIVVNMSDYTLGADKGGAVSMFDDFDIDYNQYKYLIETRVSGSLTKIKSAIVVKRAAGTVAVPVAPTYNAGTHVITIPATTGVLYQIGGVTKTAGAQPAITETTEVVAIPAATYSFAHNVDADWTFVYTA